MGTAPLDSTIAVRRDIALSDVVDNAFEPSSHDDIQGRANSKAVMHKPATASAATDRGVARAAARIDVGRLDRRLSPGASASASIDAVIDGRPASAPGPIAASKRSGAGAGIIEIVPCRMSSMRAWVAGSGSTSSSFLSRVKHASAWVSANSRPRIAGEDPQCDALAILAKRVERDQPLSGRDRLFSISARVGVFGAFLEYVGGNVIELAPRPLDPTIERLFQRELRQEFAAIERRRALEIGGLRRVRKRSESVRINAHALVLEADRICVDDKVSASPLSRSRRKVTRHCRRLWRAWSSRRSPQNNAARCSRLAQRSGCIAR